MKVTGEIRPHVMGPTLRGLVTLHQMRKAGAEDTPQRKSLMEKVGQAYSQLTADEKDFFKKFSAELAAGKVDLSQPPLVITEQAIKRIQR